MAMALHSREMRKCTQCGWPGSGHYCARCKEPAEFVTDEEDERWTREWKQSLTQHKGGVDEQDSKGNG